MAQGAPAAFFSYCREDSAFALRLAGDLKAAGASVWLDQLDIVPGQRWDRAVEDALTTCPRMLVVLSPASVSSANVMDEVSFALGEQKTVIPVLHRDCTIPFRLRRVQYVDFRQDYARGRQELLKILAPGQEARQGSSAISGVASQGQSPVSGADERERAAEQAPLEGERRKSVSSPRIRRAIGAGATILIVATGSWLVFRYRSPAPQKPDNRTVAVEHSDAPNGGTLNPVGGTAANNHLKPSGSGNTNADAGTVPAERSNVNTRGAANPNTGIAATEHGSPRKPNSPNPVAGTTSTEHSMPTTSGTTNAGTGSALERSNAITKWLAATEHWTARDSGTQDDLQSIFVTGDGKRLWAGGYYTIMESDDGGEHWNRRSLTSLGSLSRFRAAFVNSIFGTSDGKQVWAVGDEGKVAESDDAGEHWNNRNSGTQVDLRSIFGTSDGKRLWAVGDKGMVLESDDGGKHWNTRNSGTQVGLQSIFVTGDGKRLWAGGYDMIMESDDGGEHWNRRSLSSLNLFSLAGAAFVNSIFGTSDGKQVWAVGDKGTILESDDGGEDWNECFSGTKKTLLSIFGTSDGKRLWAVGDKGMVLESDDGGKHWNTRNSGTQVGLRSIFGTSDGKRVWAVGDKGTVLEAAVP